MAPDTNSGTAEACAALVRQDLAENFLRIRALAEAAIVALESGDDYDLGRSFDKSIKIFLAAAAGLEDLVEAQARP
jgi:hypothetical protein